MVGLERAVLAVGCSDCEIVTTCYEFQPGD
jgi:hypothetical protein